MTTIMQISEDEFFDRCYTQIALVSLSAGYSLQDARDSAVLVDKLMVAVGERPASNIVDLATVRAKR